MRPLKSFWPGHGLRGDEREGFHRAYRDKYGENVRLASVLGILAFGTFAMVDPFLVSGPALERVWLARVGIVFVIACLWGASYYAPAAKIPNLLIVLTCLAIGCGVVVVTFLTGGAKSNYHEAILMTMIGYSSIIVWSPFVAGASFAGIVLFYDVLLLMGGAVEPIDRFAANNAVLWGSVVIATSGVAVSQRLREIDYVRGMDLKRSNEKLLVLDSAKNAFFANVSHELRTPLMMIIAAIDSVHEQNVADLKIGQQVQIGRRNGLRLLRLVDDLLELSKLESDTIKLRWSQFHLATFVGDLADQTRALSERKGISIKIEAQDCPPIMADQHQIERVVLNLLANAIKFTGVGGTITLSLRPEGEGVAVDVADTGEGISAEALPHIFERFYQATLTTKAKRGGVGIGLSLCKRIVEIHGGRIGATSEMGRGTTLSFWLPLRGAGTASAVAATDIAQPFSPDRLNLPGGGTETSRPQEPGEKGEAGLRAPAGQAMAAEKGMPEWDQALRERADYRFFGIQEVSDRRNMPRSEVKNDGPSILVVDDNRDMVEFLLSILGADHQVWAAGDGEEGLAMARRHRPELIVSDLVMPRKSGLDFLREVRLDADLKSIPFILLTARGQERDRRESDEAQADAFLPKPFLAGDLRPIIQRLLHKQDSQGRELQDANILALRMMAAGIAHDILNPVGFVKNALGILGGIFAQAVAWVDPAVHPVDEVRRDGAEFMHSAEEGVERIVAAVGELRRFARGEVAGERVAVDVNDAVNRVIGMTRPHGIFSTDLKAAQRPHLRHGQLEQVLLNLVLNALQAGGNNCRIDIATRDDPAERVLAVQVKDAGPGMDAATLARIFDPYFTTKKTGTGLGLTMCRQIVRDHGGRLEVDSRPGGGTVFTITLPFPESNTEAPHV